MKFIVTFTLCIFFSLDVFSGLTADQIYPFASDDALQRNAQAEVRKILDERDIEFTDNFKETLRAAVAAGELLGSVIWGHRSGGKAAQDLNDWVDKNLPKPEEVKYCAEIDCGKFGTVEKLQAAARRRAELVFTQLRETYNLAEHGPKIDAAITSGALLGKAIYGFSMGTYIQDNPLELWIKANLLNTDDDGDD